MALQHAHGNTPLVISQPVESFLSDYVTALFGLWVILITVMVQAIVASVAHRRQDHYVPGIVDPNLGHESFVFRSDRTLKNSLENLILMLATSLLAILTQVDVAWVTWCIWVYALARIMHMWLYYKISTEKNPSPRSYFYLIGLLASIVLLMKTGLQLVY